MRTILLSAIAVLYVFSIPWYRAEDAPLRLVFGLPDWVAVALACYGAVALLNSVAWLLTDVRDDAELPASLHRPERSSDDGHAEGADR
jgi:hypothetical protein